MNPIEVKRRLCEIEYLRVGLWNEAQDLRGQCTHEKAIIRRAFEFECMACGRQWRGLLKELKKQVVKSWQETLDAKT